MSPRQHRSALTFLATATTGVFLVLGCNLLVNKLGNSDLEFPEEDLSQPLVPPPIRPDVAQKIEEHFKDPLIRKLATQHAVGLQMAVDHPTRALEVVHYLLQESSCGFALKVKISYDDRRLPEAWVVNNRERSRRYIEFNSRLSGRVYKGLGPDIKNCDFEITEDELRSARAKGADI